MFSFPKFPTAFVLATSIGLASLPGFATEADPASDTTPDNISTGIPSDTVIENDLIQGTEEAVVPTTEPVPPQSVTPEPATPAPQNPAPAAPQAPAPATPAVEAAKAQPVAPPAIGSNVKAINPGQPGFDIAPGVSMTRGRAALGPVSTATVVTRVDPSALVSITPVTAGGNSIRGLDTVPNMSQKAGTLMMINGGFWRSGPGGNPNGTWIVNGQMLSEPESQGVGPRGTIGWLHDGRVVVDRISANLTVSGPNGLNLKVNGINRDWRRTPDATSDSFDAVIAYNAAFGGPVRIATPPGSSNNNLTTIRVKADAWPATGTVSAKVTGVTSGPNSLTVKAGEVLITARGNNAGVLAKVKSGQTVNLNSQLIPMNPAHAGDWTQVHTAVAGGPQVLRDGQVTPAGDWVSEGFEPHIHSNVRHPRTAIGRTANNETVMVSADGRQKGYSVGLTIRELGQYMQSLGVVDAVSLDGGGSTQVTVGTQLVNRPCCDSSLRRVANGIGLKARESRVNRVRGSERIATAAAVAKSAFAKGKTPTVVLARADKYPDALSGAGLAGAVGGPVLLAEHNKVPESTMSAIRHLGATHVALLGGRAALGDGVVDQLNAAGLQVVRISGKGRADTAAEAARAIALQVKNGGGKVKHAFIVAGDQWADALVAGGAAGMLKSPILLTNPKTIDGVTANVLNDLGIKNVTLVGDTNRLSPQLETDMKVRGINANRIGQPNPYATSVQMNNWLKGGVKNMNNGLVVATGENFPDGLAAGPMAARKGVPLVLVPGKQISADPLMMEWIAGHTNAKSKLYVLGGTAVIPNAQLLVLDKLGVSTKRAKADEEAGMSEPEGTRLVAEMILNDQAMRKDQDRASTAPSASAIKTPLASEATDEPAASAKAKKKE